MHNNADAKKGGLDAALNLAKSGNIEGARSVLSLGHEITDEELIEALVAVSKGIECFKSQQIMAAIQPLQKALPIIEASSDDEAKFLIPTLINFAEGIQALISGDAHRATKLLNVSKDVYERIAFFIPGFEIVALSLKAMSMIALARAHLNAANIAAAEEVFGKAKQVYDILLKKLDPNDESQTIGFAEVYGTRFEIEFTFIMSIDIATLDLNMIKKRIESSRSDVEKLKPLINKIPSGPIQGIMSAYPIVFSALNSLYHSLEIVILKRRPFRKDEVQALISADQELFKALQICEKCGDRGRGMLYQINQMKRLQQNLLLAGKAATQNFGRFSGTVSFISLIVLIIVLHLTIKPTGYEALLYFLGGLILSLIVGFGFGALRFKPLLKLFSEALREKPG